MKYEWKKEEKNIYMPKEKAAFVEVPKYKYFAIKGKGNINSDDFAERMEILYRLSYAIKMMPKRGFIPGGYFEYSIYPIEAVWNNVDIDKSGNIADKDDITYTLIIRQPKFVTEAIARMTVTNIISTNPHPLVNEVNFISFDGGDAIQIMHTGTFDSKKKSIEQLKWFANENSYRIKDGIYHEIYISDAKRTAPERFKTVLRLMIEG